MALKIRIVEIPPYATIAIYKERRLIVAVELQSDIRVTASSALAALRGLLSRMVKTECHAEAAIAKGVVVERYPRPVRQSTQDRILERAYATGVVLRTVSIDSYVNDEKLAKLLKDTKKKDRKKKGGTADA